MKTDVTIIGAGPIGLLLANLLGSKNIKTIILDKKKVIDSRSRAIGITPPSLKTLKRIGLDNEFISRGVKIVDASVYGGNNTPLGALSFRNIPSETQFILSLPQTETEKILLKNLSQYKSVQVLFETEVLSVNNMGGESVIKAIQDNKEIQISSDVICGCDGFKSTLRNQKKIKTRYKKYKDCFLMGDFYDKTDFKDRVSLYFTPTGSVESFPLPDSKRRWVIQTPGFIQEPSSSYIINEISKRTGIELSSSDNINLSPFSVYRSIMDRFYSSDILFLGDAAHTISPIGGQGMNSGFGDADLALLVIEYILKNGPSKDILRCYSRCRKKAAKSAAFRAQLSMKIGTINGRFGSSLRNTALKILLSTPLSKSLPNHYAMLTIPYHNSDTVDSQKALSRFTS